MSQLGEELVHCPPCFPGVGIDFLTPAVVKANLIKTKARLVGLSDETLLSYPVMVDPSKIMAMDLLAKLYELMAFACEYSKLPVIPSKMILVTLEHGVSPLSPLAFVQYGNYNAIKENYEEGYHNVKLGLALMKQSPSRAYDCQILANSAYTRTHVEPLQTAIELYLDAFKAAMKSGDTGFSIKCAQFYNGISFWAGKNLGELARSMKETMMLIRFHKNLLFASMMLPIVRLTLRMVSESATTQQNSLTSVFGEILGEEDVAAKIPSVVIAKHFNGFYEGLIFREFDKARDCAESFFSLKTKSTGVLYHRVL